MVSCPCTSSSHNHERVNSLEPTWKPSTSEHIHTVAQCMLVYKCDLHKWTNGPVLVRAARNLALESSHPPPPHEEHVHGVRRLVLHFHG